MIKADSLPTSDQIVKLWAHECLRVFSDRLIDEQQEFNDILFKSCREKVREDLDRLLRKDERKKDFTQEELIKDLIFGDLLGEQAGAHDRNYNEIEDFNEALEKCKFFLESLAIFGK